MSRANDQGVSPPTYGEKPVPNPQKKPGFWGYRSTVAMVHDWMTMPAVNAPRLPVGPLLRRLALLERSGRGLGTRHQRALDHGKLDGSLTWRQADLLACALGCHPCELWGDDWWGVDTEYRRREQNHSRLGRLHKKLREIAPDQGINVVPLCSDSSSDLSTLRGEFT